MDLNPTTDLGEIKTEIFTSEDKQLMTIGIN